MRTNTSAYPTAVGENVSRSGHSMDIQCVTVMDKETGYTRRKVKEALFIQSENPTLNRDQGYELPKVYKQLMSHD